MATPDHGINIRKLTGLPRIQFRANGTSHPHRQRTPTPLSALYPIDCSNANRTLRQITTISVYHSSSSLHSAIPSKSLVSLTASSSHLTPISSSIQSPNRGMCTGPNATSFGHVPLVMKEEKTRWDHSFLSHIAQISSESVFASGRHIAHPLSLSFALSDNQHHRRSRLRA